MKFAHIGDCHLGGWRNPELRDLNFNSFKEAINRCIFRKVDFILIAGDLFDTAYPPIDTLKEAFEVFKIIKEANIPVFIIAGSHDYSVSGKTFLDVLEKAGFCINVADYVSNESYIELRPTIHKGTAIYGYPGKKSGLEVDEISKIKIQPAPGLFSILMLHTTIRDAIGNAPVNAVEHTVLPKVDYIALSHLHINYCKENRAYSGPTFPNNLSEIEELKHGSFYIFDDGQLIKEELKLKDVVSIDLEINNALTATEDILSLIQHKDLKDKILTVRISGILNQGKIADIDFQKIESLAKSKGAYVFLKGTSKLHVSESDISLDTSNLETVESEIIANFQEKNPSKFNSYIPDLMRILMTEKHEDETSSTFSDRILTESKQVLSI